MTATLPRRWRRLAAALALAPGLTGPLAAQTPAADAKADAKPAGATPGVTPSGTATPLTLAQCLAIGRERQPLIQAAYHSYRATEVGAKALGNLGFVAGLVTPDLPVRRQQASRGLTLAAAEIQKVTQENTQDITVLYYSYVYARQQELTASDIVEQLEIYYEAAEGIVRSGVRDPKMRLNQFSLYTLQNVISDVKAQRLKAETGRKLALEALRDAMGADGGLDFVPAAKELPLMLSGTITQEQVVAEALARRPELAQAAAGVDAFRLEVCAQASVKSKRQVSTLAVGSDLHSKQVPMGVRNGEYKPGALAPEMPASLVGKTEDRVARAAALSLRQDALYDRTASLVRLEASKAFLTWDAATRRVVEAKKKYERGRQLVEESRSAAIAKLDPEILVTNEALAGKSQTEYVEAVFDHVKALAALERITAGGVVTQFPGR